MRAVRVLLGRPDAVAGYESALRRLGSPQATAWYVDLLWRAGRIDRAEQVWKAVRSNKRVLGCDELRNHCNFSSLNLRIF